MNLEQELVKIKSAISRAETNKSRAEGGLEEVQRQLTAMGLKDVPTALSHRDLLEKEVRDMEAEIHKKLEEVQREFDAARN